MSKNLTAIDIAQNTIKKKNLFSKSNYLLLMVSGGSDSVALCYIINAIQKKKKFAIMHLNHQLRDNAKEDANFVKDLAWHFDVPYFGFSENILEIAKTSKQNIESCGHNVRYKLANDAVDLWSKEQSISRDKILLCTAHTADDRIENFYMRSIVGTGPGGFASLRYKNDNVIRPLLDISKEVLIDYIESLDDKFVDENGHSWKEDQTNYDTDRFRAYVRHNIIPLAKHQNPKLIDNLCNSMNLIADESEYIENHVSEVIDKYIKFDDKSFTIMPGFLEVDLVLARRAVYNSLIKVFKNGTRIETATINSIIEATQTSNYTNNIQENYSVHSNKQGTLVQPMANYRKSRKRI